MLQKLMILMTLTLVLTACNKSKKESDVISGSSVAHVGSTYTVCYNDNTESAFHEVIFIDQENLTWETTYYSNIDCVDGDKTMSDLFTGKYRFNLSTGVFSEMYLKDELTLYTQDLIDDAEAAPACGQNAWALGVAQDITGSDGCPYGDFEAGTTYYDRPNSSIGGDSIVIDGITMLKR